MRPASGHCTHTQDRRSALKMLLIWQHLCAKGGGRARRASPAPTRRCAPSTTGCCTARARRAHPSPSPPPSSKSSSNTPRTATSAHPRLPPRLCACLRAQCVDLHPSAICSSEKHLISSVPMLTRGGFGVHANISAAALQLQYLDQTPTLNLATVGQERGADDGGDGGHRRLLRGAARRVRRPRAARHGAPCMAQSFVFSPHRSVVAPVSPSLQNLLSSWMADVHTEPFA